MSSRAPRPAEREPEVLIASLHPEDLRLIVTKAAERHADVARALRLAATRGSGDLSQLRAEVDSPTGARTWPPRPPLERSATTSPLSRAKPAGTSPQPWKAPSA